MYLDYHAATPLCAAARDAMVAASASAFANPASVHGAGRRSRKLLEEARQQIAVAVTAKPTDVVLTSGGTEACNLGLLGLLGDPRSGGYWGHIISTGMEHPAVAKVLDMLEVSGVAVSRLAVPDGVIPSVETLKSQFREDTRLVAVQWVNHETGTINPVPAYATACAERGIAFFVDGTQALGKVVVDLSDVPLTALALASHKAGGPAGAGALVVRRTCDLVSRQIGGGQERGRRAGSPDVVSMAGFGAACGALDSRLAVQLELGDMRDALEATLVELGARVNGAGAERVATVTNASFRGLRGSDLVVALDIEGLCVASGAACSSGLAEPSAVLRAMYPTDKERATGALRLSLGPECLQLPLMDIQRVIRRVLGRFLP